MIVIEPKTRIDLHGGRHRLPVGCRSFAQPYLPRAFRIAFDKIRCVGLRAVGDDLNRRCVARAVELLREIARDYDKAANFPVGECLLHLAPASDDRFDRR